MYSKKYFDKRFCLKENLLFSFRLKCLELFALNIPRVVNVPKIIENIVSISTKNADIVRVHIFIGP
jgi:hypothetical protein